MGMILGVTLMGRPLYYKGPDFEWLFIILLGAGLLIGGYVILTMMRKHQRDHEPDDHGDDAHTLDNSSPAPRTPPINRDVQRGALAADLRAARSAAQAARGQAASPIGTDAPPTSGADWRTNPPRPAGQEIITVPPGEDALRELLIRFAKPAIGFRRDCPPVHPAETLSFLGGLPVVPPGWAWPIGRNTGRPLHFIAQIDIGALPDSAFKDQLPEEGVLYFFFEHLDSTIRTEGGQNLRTNGKLGNCVQFCSGPTTGWRAVSIPGQMAENPSYMLRWAQAGGERYATFTKWPVTPVLMNMYPRDQAFLEGEHAISLDLSQRTDNDRGSFEASWVSAHTALRSAEEARVFSQPVASNRPIVETSGASRVGVADLPQVWLAPEIFCGRVMQDYDRPNLASHEHLEQRARFEEEADALIAQARAGDPMRRMSDEEARAFQRFRETCASLCAPRGPGFTTFAIRTSDFDDAADEARSQSIAACLAHSAEAAALVLPGEAEQLCRLIGQYRHWMGGYASDLDHGFERHGENGKVLLLEIGNDPVLGLAERSDSQAPMAMQFWIDPNDLADRRFDQAFVVLQFA